MAPLIAAAIPVLADLIPDAIGWFAGDDAEQAAEEVLGIAQQVTGLGTKDEALEAIKSNPEVALQFKIAVMRDKHRLDEMYLADKADARDNYDKSKDQADEMADFILKWNLVIIALTFLGQCVGTYYLQDSATLVAMINSMGTMIIKSLLDERKEVNGFYFGSSLGSKMKDKKDL